MNFQQARDVAVFGGVMPHNQNKPSPITNRPKPVQTPAKAMQYPDTVLYRVVILTKDGKDLDNVPVPASASSTELKARLVAAASEAVGRKLGIKDIVFDVQRA